MNLDITRHDHFKLYVLIEDRFTFENELRKKGVEYYSNPEGQIGAMDSIRFYLKDEDRVVVDKIIIDNKLNTGIESTRVHRFEFNRKPLAKFILIILGLIILIIIVDYLI